LFLTENGAPYTRSAFYYHWEKLFEPAQKQFKTQERVEFSPHDIRHVRVSRAITKIKHEAKGDKSLEEELTDGFWRLMGWQSRDTMDVYTHVFTKRKALLEVMLEDTNEPLLESLQHNDLPMVVEDQHPAPDARLPSVGQDENDFDWYEQ
jgi:integrase